MAAVMGKETDDQLKEMFPDLPSGPLEDYRKKASFDWRRMKLVYDNLNAIQLKDRMYKYMESSPLFRHADSTLPLDDDRHITTKRMYAIYNENFASMEKLATDPSLYQAETEAMFMFDSALAVKVGLTFRMFQNTIRGSGRPHHYHYIEAIDKAQIGGCFALTEIAHGSNAKGMRTTATYVPERKKFILHSPDFEAAKCWVGALGKCATHAIVYAMLISKGKNHGLHAFVVPIRDTQTLKPFPGVIVGDIGEKIGLNGIDNGFVMFNKYELDKEAALDKIGGVNEAGDYETPFKDPKKRFGASLGVLSGGRVHIASITTNYLVKAIVIATRYSAVRRQFGPENSSEELPVLEYQQQQIRVLPYLAATYAMRIFSNWFGVVHIQLTIDNMMGAEDTALRGIELHALSSATKPVCGWTARDGIQNCREACGGHGYLKAASLGDIRNDNDANLTYEGENSLLLQQTSNWLLGVWARNQHSEDSRTPLGSMRFLEKANQLVKETCPWNTVEDMIKPENLVKSYNWLTAFMLKTTAEKVDLLKKSGKDAFVSKNDSQSYNAVTLSVVYGENFILNHFYETALKFEDPACRAVLLKLVSLYGAFMLERHLGTLYIGGWLKGQQGVLLREGVLLRCSEIAPEAVALADTLAPPAYCLKSVLGQPDGEAYKHIQNSFFTYPGALTRPHWWRDVVFWDSYIPAKL